MSFSTAAMNSGVTDVTGAGSKPLVTSLSETSLIVSGSSMTFDATESPPGAAPVMAFLRPDAAAPSLASRSCVDAPDRSLDGEGACSSAIKLSSIVACSGVWDW